MADMPPTTVAPRWRRAPLPGGAMGRITLRSEEAPVARDLVTGVVPPQVLHEDEIVLLLVKPSLWLVPFDSARFILLTAALGVLAVRVLQYSGMEYLTPYTVATLASLLVLGRLIWALLQWTSHIYLLTNQRIITIKGVVNVSIYQANLRKIQRTVLYKPLLERVLGLGTIGFATAATAGSRDADSTWIMIPRPDATHQQVVAAIHKVQ